MSFVLSMQKYPARREGAFGYLCVQVAEWLKAPGRNPGSRVRDIAGSTPALHTTVRATAAAIATMAMAVVAILLP